MGTLSSILESCMLLCCGASWPLSVIKNYKAKSAKAMSLPFILLIVTGYICGIIAKFAGLSAGKTTPIYVFVVYFFNLIVVSINIVLYFINRGYDKKKEAEEAKNNK